MTLDLSRDKSIEKKKKNRNESVLNQLTYQPIEDTPTELLFCLLFSLSKLIGIVAEEICSQNSRNLQQDSRIEGRFLEYLIDIGTTAVQFLSQPGHRATLIL